MKEFVAPSLDES